MFCPNCGKQLLDDAVFCEQCGEKISPVEGPQPVPTPPPTEPQKREEKKVSQFIKKKGKIIGIICAAVVIIAAVVVFLVTRPLTVELNDYITAEFSGYDTMGDAFYRFDEEAFCRDFAGKIKYRAGGDASSFLDDETICQMLLQECIMGDLSEDTDLSNGDEISFQWACDDDMAKEHFGVQLKYEDLTFTVEGLEEAAEVDPFEDVELVFSGIAPNGEVSLVNNSEESFAYDLQYEVEPSDGLSNGDTITVSLLQAESQEDRAYYLRSYGVTFTQTEKTYTVEGLGTFVSELSEIDEATLGEMQARGEDALRAEAAKDWDELVSLDNMSYLGGYLLTAKDADEEPNNVLYLVYQIQSTISVPEEELQESFTYYYTVSFENLIAEADGTVQVDLGDYRTSNDQFWKDLGTRRYYYHGYADLDTLLRECVSVNVDRYSYETNIMPN